MADDPVHDVAVAGAGLTGLLSALSLAHHGLDVVLVDPAPAGAVPQDGRTTALSYAAVRLLKRLDLWRALEAQASPINDIVVTDGVPGDRFRPGRLAAEQLHFPSRLLPIERTGPQGSPLGFIVENAAMLDTFGTAARTNERITWITGKGVAGVKAGAGLSHLSLTDGSAASARLTLACDGKNSPLRTAAGLRRVAWDYDQVAMTFTIAHEAPHGGIAYEAFYPGGPFAILPLTGHRSSIVWTEKRSKAGAFLALDDEAFLAEVRERMGERFGEMSLEGERHSYPLSFHYTPDPIADRLALIGDSAHAIHPIAGQGFNLGVKDIAALTDVLCTAKRAGLDIGHGSVLDQYARWRRFDVTTLALGTDVMNRLFSNRLPGLSLARRTGLGLVNRIDPARKLFMRHAGADLGELPPLMQPF